MLIIPSFLYMSMRRLSVYYTLSVTTSLLSSSNLHVLATWSITYMSITCFVGRPCHPGTHYITCSIMFSCIISVCCREKFCSNVIEYKGLVTLILYNGVSSTTIQVVILVWLLCYTVDEHWPETREFITQTVELWNRRIRLSCYNNRV